MMGGVNVATYRWRQARCYLKHRTACPHTGRYHRQPGSRAVVATVDTASLTARSIDPLTGLRFVAAIWVLQYHFSDTVAEAVPQLGGIRTLASGGYVGVDLFFVLSGFIIAHVYLHVPDIHRPRGAARYLWLRLARFYPVHLLTLGVIAFLLALEHVTQQDWVPQDGPYTPVTFARNLLLVHAWGSSFAWNGPAWSISAEWFAYLMFPLLAFVLLRVSRWLLAVGAVFAIPAGLAMMTVLVGGFLHFESGPPILRIAGSLVAGCCVYRLYEAAPSVSRRWSGVALASTALMILVATVLAAQGWNAMLAAPLIPLVIYSLARGQGGFASLLATPTMLLWGAVSYSLYMTHLIVLNCVRAIVGGMPTGVAGVAVAVLVIALSLAVAYCTYHWVEEPCRRAMRARSPVRVGGGR